MDLDAIARADGAPAPRSPPERLEATTAEQAETLLDTLFAASPLGLAIFDTQLRCIRLNARMEQLNSAPAAGLLGRRLTEAFGPLPEVLAVEGSMGEVLRTGEPRTSVPVAGPPDADGARRHFLASWYPLRSLHGAVRGLAAVVEDVTDRVSAERVRVRTAQRATRLLALAEALGRARDSGEVARAAVEVAYPHLGAVGGGIAALDRERHCLCVLARAADSAALQRDWPEVPLSVDIPFTRAVVERRVVRADVDEVRKRFPAAHAAMSGLGGTLTVASPLLDGDDVIGSMSVLYGEQPPDLADEEYLSTVVAMTAQALARAQRADAAVSSVRQLQGALLPGRLPSTGRLSVAARYRSPSRAGAQVGGDFYDVVHTDPGTVTLLVGDVEGHDLAAAALMAQLRAVSRSLLLDAEPPSQVLARADAFLATLDVPRLVTVVCLQLDLASGTAVVATAGHPLPLLVDAAGARPVGPVDPGPPLGVPGARWTETTVAVPHGVLLVLFTDGVVERRGQDLDEAVAGIASRAHDLRHADLEVVAEGVIGESLRRGDLEDDAAVLVARTAAASSYRPLGRTATRRFPSRPVSAVVARWWIRDVLPAWGVDDEAVATVQLLVSELVGNAVRHTGDPLGITLARRRAVLYVGVRDASLRMPVPQVAAEGDTSGRGLLLVEALSDRWGVEEDDSGKTVWFEVVAGPVRSP